MKDLQNRTRLRIRNTGRKADLKTKVEGDILDGLLQALHGEGEGVRQLVLLPQLLPCSREVTLKHKLRKSQMRRMAGALKTYSFLYNVKNVLRIPSWPSVRSLRRRGQYPPAGSRRCTPPLSPAPPSWGRSPSPWTSASRGSSQHTQTPRE